MIKRASVDEIQKSIDNFVKGLPQKENFDKVYALLKDLSLDSDGNIKVTIGNLKIISRVRQQFENLIDSDIYQEKVSDLEDSLDKIKEVQTIYLADEFKDFTKPKSIDELQDLTFDSIKESLLGAGISEYVINDSVDIVEQGIRDGESFYDMVENLRSRMLGNNSRLVSYSKQIINDTLSSFSRSYHSIVTEDLDLQYFQYVGALKNTSRPFCDALIEKGYIHKSELGAISRGLIDGKKVSLQGLMPGTNKENIINRCGGYNCSHQMVPISATAVPSKIRRKFEKEVKPDNEELADERPKSKR